MRKALIVGINNYPTYPLKSCVNDAVALCKLLNKNSDGSPNFDVKLETEIVNKRTLKERLIGLFNQKCDIALFYFSGHGFRDNYGSYIVTPDWESKYDIGITMDEILAIANKSEATHKIIILDCCYAGDMGLPHFLGNEITFLREGVTILTSSANEISGEKGNHGIFTKILLEAINGSAADLMGEINTGSIYLYLDKHFGAWDQRPTFKMNTSSFPVLRKVEPKVPIAILRKLPVYFKSEGHVILLDSSFKQNNTTKNGSMFEDLKKLERINLVMAIDSECLDTAAENSKSCKLTLLGTFYWRLMKR